MSRPCVIFANVCLDEDDYDHTRICSICIINPEGAILHQLDFEIQVKPQAANKDINLRWEHQSLTFMEPGPHLIEVRVPGAEYPFQVEFNVELRQA